MELAKKWDGNGFGFKHWFQDEMGLVLIKRGISIANKQYRDRAANMLRRFWRSGIWASTWGKIRRKRRAQPSTTTLPNSDPNFRSRSGNKRSRPRKKTRGPGRPRGASSKRVSTPRSAVGRPVGATPLQKARIESLAFCSPAPFVPKRCGRRMRTVGADVNDVVVRGVKHTLTHMCAVMDPETGERMWKSNSGRCVCCYGSTPPLTRAQRVANPNRRKKVTQSSFVCDKCLVCLCRDCFHREWPKHSKKINILPVSSVYV